MELIRSTLLVVLSSTALFLLLPSMAYAAEGDITFTQVPKSNQLYPRDLATNQAIVEVSGTVVIPGRSEVVLRVTQNGSGFSEVTTPLTYSGDGASANFSISTALSAGLFDYEIEILTRAGGSDEQVRLVRDITVGDVYLINGQSNAMAWQNYPDDSASDSRDYFIRTLGVTSNISETVMANQTWYRATGDGYRTPGSIGQWGLHLAKRLVDSYDMPIAMINQGNGGKGIDYFQRNDSDPGDITTNYGRMLYRANQAGVTDRVRAILWYQGEADGLFADKHQDGFEDLHADWNRDYDRLERVYIHQIRNGCGGATPEMLEIQRRFADSLSSPEVVALSTNGLDGHDGCHYYYTDGYQTLAEQLFGVMAEELYGRPAEPNTYPPNLDTARLDNGNTEIVLEMRDSDDSLTFESGAENDFLLECSPGISVTGGTVNGNTIRLSLSGEASDVKAISYVGHPGEGPWITNGKDIGLLSFKHELDSSNRLPSVSVGNIVSGTLFAVGTPINLEALVDDCDGIITRVWFYANGTELHTMPKGPWEFSWPDAPLGTHSITIEARDDDDDRVLSAPINVTVIEPVGVNLNAPAVGDVYLAGAPINLEAALSNESNVAEVQFFYGDQLIGSATSSPWSITWENAPVGEQTLTAAARSSEGNVTESIPVAVRITEAPTVAVTQPAAEAIFMEGQAVPVTADAADDNSVAQVEFFANDVSLGVDSEAPWEATLLDSMPGGYVLKAVATDNDGFSTTSASVQMGIHGIPQVSLTSPPTGTVANEGGSITMVAEASVISGTIDQVVFAIDGTATYTDTEAPWEVEWNSLTIGDYQISAVATDDLGNTAEASPVQVTIQEAPQLSLTAATTAVAVGEGLSITAAVNRSDITIASVAFYAGETLLFTDDSAPYEYMWSDGPAGAHEVRVVATDSAGGTIESDPITVRFMAMPTVALSADQTSVTAGTIVTVTADAADADGTISEVQLYNGETVVGTATEAPYVFELSDLAEGSYTLTAVAMDNDGQSTRSEALAIEVAASPPIGTDSVQTFLPLFNGATTQSE